MLLSLSRVCLCWLFLFVLSDCLPSALADEDESSDGPILLYADDFEDDSSDDPAFDWSDSWSGKEKKGVLINQFFSNCAETGDSCLRLMADGSVNRKVVTERSADLTVLAASTPPVAKITLSFHAQFFSEDAGDGIGTVSVAVDSKKGTRFRKLRRWRPSDEDGNAGQTVTLDIPQDFWTSDFTIRLRSKGKSASTDFYIDDVKITAMLGENGDGPMTLAPTGAPPTAAPSTATAPPTTGETLAPTAEDGDDTLAPTADGTMSPVAEEEEGDSQRKLTAEEEDTEFFGWF